MSRPVLSSDRIAETADMFDPATTARVIGMQNIVPVVATIVSYATFSVVAV